MKLSYLEITQPIGTFYMVSIPAETLFRIVEVRRHDIETFDGVQRELSHKRVSEISRYCTEEDAVFPTAIVVSVDKGVPYSIDTKARMLFLPDNVIIGDVIDGQHRLWGIKQSGCKDNFELPVVLMFDLELAEKAYVFSIINSTQTKVNKSLIFNLFGLSNHRSPYKTCHEIARALNGKEGTPFYQRMKMLGKKDPEQPNASLSQGTFVKQLLRMISRNPDEDNRRLKADQMLSPDTGLPLRQYFIDGRDDVISKIIVNCFSALKKTFLQEWRTPDSNILWKTTGFCGVMLALNTIMRKGIIEKDLTEEFFNKVFVDFKLSLIKYNISLTSKDFPGGGEQNQKRLSRLIVASISNLNNSTYSQTDVEKDFSDFVSAISGDMSIHEKYELFQILDRTTEVLSFFTVTENSKNKTITINYPYEDASITVPFSSLNALKKVLEEKLFDGLDADSWYSYELAMDKDD